MAASANHLSDKDHDGGTPLCLPGIVKLNSLDGYTQIWRHLPTPYQMSATMKEPTLPAGNYKT
jgi:hypothetical protein